MATHGSITSCFVKELEFELAGGGLGSLRCGEELRLCPSGSRAHEELRLCPSGSPLTSAAPPSSSGPASRGHD